MPTRACSSISASLERESRLSALEARLSESARGSSTSCADRNSAIAECLSVWSEDWLKEVLHAVPLLKMCSIKEIETLIESATEQSFAVGETVVREGEFGDAMYIIVTGFASCTKGGVQVHVYQRGGYFGERAALSATGLRRGATVTATSQLKVLMLSPDSIRTAISIGARVTGQKFVALVANNEMKPTLMAFVAENLDFFKGCRIITTGSTGAALEKGLGLKVEKQVSSGPLGGDQEIGSAVGRGEVAALFFLRDPLSSHPHEADIQALVRLADVHNVALATNQQTAMALVYALTHQVVLAGELRPDAIKQTRDDTDAVSRYKSHQSAVIQSVAQQDEKPRPK